MLEQDWSNKTDSPKLNQYKKEWNNLVIQKGILNRRARPRELRGDPLAVSLTYCTIEKLLSGDAMMRSVTWAWNACLTSCMIGSFGLALGCSGKGAHWEMLPMFSFQSQTAKSTSRKYHGHSSPGAGPSGFSMPGTCERPGRKCSSDN